MMSNLFKHLDLSTALEKRGRHEDEFWTEIDDDFFSSGRVALCIVDMQTQYCSENAGGSKETEAIVEDVIALKKLFNEKNLPVFVVYMDAYRKGIENAGGGLYGIEFNKETDIPIAKDSDSVFKASRWVDGSHISKHLEEMGIDKLIVVGAHFAQCVMNTAVDASEQYETIIVGDCTANGQTVGAMPDFYCLERLSMNGVGFASYKDVAGRLEVHSEYNNEFVFDEIPEFLETVLEIA